MASQRISWQGREIGGWGPQQSQICLINSSEHSSLHCPEEEEEEEEAAPSHGRHPAPRDPAPGSAAAPWGRTGPQPLSPSSPQPQTPTPMWAALMWAAGVTAVTAVPLSPCPRALGPRARWRRSPQPTLSASVRTWGRSPRALSLSPPQRGPAEGETPPRSPPPRGRVALTCPRRGGGRRGRREQAWLGASPLFLSHGRGAGREGSEALGSAHPGHSPWKRQSHVISAGNHGTDGANGGATERLPRRPSLRSRRRHHHR